MTIQKIQIGTHPNDGTGDTLRTSFTKVNENFQDVYDTLGVQANNANVINTYARFNTDVIYSHANDAFSRANVAYAYSVQISNDVGYAYNNSNTAFDSANGVIANTTFAFRHANASYSFANTLSVQLNNPQQGVYSRINVVFNFANTVSNQLNDSNYGLESKANSIYRFANIVFGRVNSVYSSSNSSFNQANIARSHANAAFLYANNIFGAAAGALANTSGVSFNGSLYFPAGKIGVGRSSATHEVDVSGNVRATFGSGSVVLGKHPNYTNNVAVWKDGSDYAVLINDTDTMVNAPSGRLRFRKGNVDSGYFDENQKFYAKNLYDLDDPTYYVDPAGSSRVSTVEATTEVSAPIFYDSNDKNYYVNPAAESKLKTITSDFLNATNARVDSTQKYPLSRYADDGTVFSIDPTWTQDQLRTFFNNQSVTWVEDAGAPGGYCISITGEVEMGGQSHSGFPYITIGENEIFYMEIWVKNNYGPNHHFMGSSEYDHTFAFIGGNPGPHGFWAMNDDSPGNTGSGWRKYNGYVSGFAAAGAPRNKFVNGAKYWTPYAKFNAGTSSGVTYISGWKAIRLNRPGGLAVDSLRLGNVSRLSQSPYNGFLMLQGENIFTAGGTQTYYPARTMGRGSDEQTDIGLDSMKVVCIPEETGSGSYPIDAGTNGHQFAYALFSNGRLYTWGNNSKGQCGVGHNNRVFVPTLAAENVTNVYISPNNSADVSYTKVIIRKSDGFLYASGFNGNGQLGLGDTSDRNIFSVINSLGTDIQSVWNLGSNRGALVVQKGDDTIWVAGMNLYGQLGTGTTAQAVSTPVNVTSAWGGAANSNKILRKAICGSDDVFGTWIGMLIEDEDDRSTTFRLSGYNVYGTLGDNSTTNSSTPTSPSVGTGRIVDVAGFGGGPGTIYLLKENGQLYTWGHNAYGQCGHGDVATPKKAPILNTLTGVRELFSDGSDNPGSAQFTQGFVRTDEGLYTTGYNAHGELGVGDSTNRTSFTKVRLPANFQVEKLGWYCTANQCKTFIAKAVDGRLYVWGHNGALGAINRGVSGIDYTAPVQLNIPLGA